MYPLKFLLVLVAIIYASAPSQAQKRLSETEAVELALKNSAAFKAADVAVAQNKYLQRGAFSLPNPEVIAESPTGEFYAVGILQAIEFPTVYAQQSKLRKQMTRLAEKQRTVTRNDIVKFVKTLYLNVQVSENLVRQMIAQDSLYASLAVAAKRQFEAGTIDYLAKTFAEAQAGDVHSQRIASESDHQTLVQQLNLYTGEHETIVTTPLRRFEWQESLLPFDTTFVEVNPIADYYRQSVNVNKRSLSVERNKALPGLVFGYLNQGARETDTYYRFRVGFTLPLWFWQYSANIKSAKAGVLLAENELRAQKQNLSAEWISAINNVKKYSALLAYYESEGNRHAEEIISTARRLFESGQTDYMQYLRSVNEAFLIKTKYLETLRSYNESILSINHLNGRP